MKECMCPHCGGKFVATIVDVPFIGFDDGKRQLIHATITEYENRKQLDAMLDVLFFRESMENTKKSLNSEYYEEYEDV